MKMKNSLELRFECYVQLGDKINAKYTLKKLRKYSNKNMEKYEQKLRQLKNRGALKKVKYLQKCASPFCLNVEEEPKEFQCCSGCRNAAYCSRKCQKLHWKNGHKEACKDRMSLF